MSGVVSTIRQVLAAGGTLEMAARELNRRGYLILCRGQEYPRAKKWTPSDVFQVALSHRIGTVRQLAD